MQNLPAKLTMAAIVLIGAAAAVLPPPPAVAGEAVPARAFPLFHMAKPPVVHGTTLAYLYNAQKFGTGADCDPGSPHFDLTLCGPARRPATIAALAR